MPSLTLDVRANDGTQLHVPLSGQTMVVGRAREAQVFLDSRTISRRHAEFVCDPFGRWWVRDLGSHNGTLVNGLRVAEQLLKSGDLIQVGEFSITLASAEETAPVESSSTVIVPSTEPTTGRITSLRDFETPRLAATHLSTLSEFGQRLLSIESVADRLNALCALMVHSEFHGRSAIVLRASKESFTEPPKPLCNPQTAPGEQSNSSYISRTLLRTMLARNEPVLASNAPHGPQPPGALRGGAADMAELSISSDVMSVSAIACPIKSEQHYTDLLYVLFPPEYGNSEWLALTSLAAKQFQQAESTWAARKLGEDHAAIERELSRAHAIQKRLVPKDFSVPGLDFAIGFTPCRWVGGDYVDVLQSPDGKIFLTIADVCGKGLPAALVASSLHTLTHTAMRAGSPLATIMQTLNLYLAESLTDGTFVTMIAAMLDPAAESLEIINAGHPPGFFLTPAGELTFTQSAQNLPLGLDERAPFVSDKASFPKNDYLVLYTDGLSELPLADGQILGEETLGQHVATIIREGAGALPAADLSGKLTTLLDSLQSGMSRDDRTFLVARRL
jgi:serine phosphatase RsbU (regulator of sigma subunit)/pSer/pThr/pTyr-binding forkhead associated (FHA) protein